jgi:bifunctional non-homologous end joining protein LigD
MENITLYYREGSSDKVYQCQIEASGEGFVVNFAYGRRGATLNTGTKTSTPVDYPTAKNTFDKLVREKTAKGYTPGEHGTPYQNTPKAEQATGISPQLLNPIDVAEVERLIASDDWVMQEKHDGRRLLLRKDGAAIHGINRKGLLVGLPSPIVVQAHKIPGDFILDGECVGDVLYAFDLLQLRGMSLLNHAYVERLDRLCTLLEDISLTHIELVETAYGANEKRSWLEKFKTDRREGAVFKRLDAPYTPGRPNKGGSQLKHKFTATLSAVVSKLNEQRSVELRLIGKSGWVTAGNVTIPANQKIPQVGQVVEVRYLYAFPESGVLFQPVYLGRRTDIEPAECMVSQLKFKAVEDDDQ